MSEADERSARGPARTSVGHERRRNEQGDQPDHDRLSSAACATADESGALKPAATLTDP